jgi:exonuclease SbcD
MFRFLHAADLHLDSPLRGLDRYEGAPVELFRRAGREAMENLVALALREEVRFVVLAGDLFDGDWPDVNTGLFFVKQMAVLNQGGISVYIVAGNHDAANRMTRSLPYPENVRVFPSDRPVTFQVEELPVAVHGQSYAAQDVRENLAAQYPSPAPGCFNIGLLHTALEGRAGHAPYAPCRMEELLSRGYDYWALGHAHQRESVSPDPRVPIEFPGNIQGRHVRETGPKGCLIVEVDDRRHAVVRFHALDVCRWARLEVDLQGVEAAAELQQRFERVLRAELERAEGRPLAARVVLHGRCPWHHRLLAQREKYRDEIRAQAIDQGGGQVWIEEVEIRTTPPSEDADQESLTDDAWSELLRAVRELRQELAAGVTNGLDIDDLNQLLNRLPPEMAAGDEALDFSSSGLVGELLEQAAALIVEQKEAEEDRR